VPRAGVFHPAFYALATVHMERIHVQRRLKQVTNSVERIRGYTTSC
jgi:hypothetical protein